LNPLDGLDFFDLGRFLIVFGFTLAVIRYTNHLSEFKSPREQSRKILLVLGIVSIVIGIMIGGLIVLSGDQYEMKIKGIGTDIIAIGFSVVCQSVFYSKKQQNYLQYGVWFSIGIGFLICTLVSLARKNGL
jgi:hypothetical protein